MKVKELLERKEELAKKIAELEKQLEPLKKEKGAINEALDNFVIKNKLYLPIDRLKDYAGKDVYEITLIDESGEEYNFYYGDIMEITEDGHFYYSDYENGIYEYDPNTNNYHRDFCHSRENRTIVGFRDLCLGYFTTDKKEVEESFFENIYSRFPEGEVDYDG